MHTTEPDPIQRQSPEPATVLCVDDDSEYLALIKTAFDERADLFVLTETDSDAALDRLDGVDCLVSADHDILDAVRARVPDLPFVLHTSSAVETFGDTLLGTERADYLEKGWSESHMTLLARRVRSLVAQQRLATTARRYGAALETSREATLIVDADGTVAFANERLASVFADDHEALTGRAWDALFTDESVVHLRQEALPVAADGWSWTGSTTLLTWAGETDCPRTTLSRLDDGSLIFTFHELEHTGEAE